VWRKRERERERKRKKGRERGLLIKFLKCLNSIKGEKTELIKNVR
jgi:hypothetical protein